MSQTTDCDVLVVGGGPTGASLALLLAQQQARVIVIDREADIYPMPRAAHVDHEVMRIFQSLGLADDIMSTSRSVARYDFLNAEGELLMRFAGMDQPGPGGWPNSSMIHQPSVERSLRRRIAQEQRIDFRTRWSFESCTDGYENISAQCSTPDGMQTLTARFLIGADGTRSRVRECAGIELDDLQFDESWLVIDTIVHNASRLPDANLQICDPARPTTCVLMGNGRHRWEFMVRPDEDPQDLLDDSVIEQLLRPWKVQGAVTLERKAVYRFNARVAKTWRKGRVLLAGDAAHQMPPFAGQGMCAGLRDAMNLGWKLGAVLRGAPATLLDDYQREREPNVRMIIEMSIMMGRTVCITDSAAAAERDAGMLAARPTESPPLSAPVYPPLGAGCLLAQSRGAGSYFPQLLTGSEQRLDDVVGSGPWLICRSARASNQAEVAGTDLETVSLEDAALAPYREALSAWLDEHDAEAVLVRPDHYVYGTGTTPELLSAWQAQTNPKQDLTGSVR